MMGRAMMKILNARSFVRSVRLQTFFGVAIAALIGSWTMFEAASATAPGLNNYLSPLRQSASAQKIALLIVPGISTSSPRWAVGHADEEVYRKRLLELGFDVFVIGPSDRFELDRQLRNSTARIPNGADVAVLVLGSAISDADDVRIVPSDAPADLTERSDLLEAETVRLSDVLRRIASRAPRNLVAIIDECRRIGATDQACAVQSAASPRDASVIAARRKAPRPGASPLIARASLRDDLLPLLSQEALTFADLHASLVQRLAPTNLTVDATPTLTGAFSFVPAGFFAAIATDCNKVDLNADPVALKAANLDGLQRSCDAAVTQYPYARHFIDRQSAVKEQRAFQRAVASCADAVAISGFAAAYPASRFKRVVEEFSLACSRERDDARLQREAQERERAVRDAQERDRLQREAQERERIQREAQERQRLQREAQERERLQREAQERDRLQREAQERERLQREAQERERLQREAQERERAQRDAQERERAQREAQERERAQREAQEQQAAQRVLQQLAQTFVSRFYWTSSSEGERSGARLSDLYASVVNFYGQQRTLSDIMADKIAYNQRWTNRRFIVKPGSVGVVCDAGSGGCRVSGFVEFDVDGPGRSARGLTSFEFGVVNITSAPRIVSEQSKVEQRY